MEYLKRFGWNRYQAVDEPFEQEGLIRTGWRSSEDAESYVMSIDPMVERNCLSFKVHQLLYVPLDLTSPGRLSNLWLAMSYINYRIILGKFSYDPRDGEVLFSVDMPIDDNTFTYAQFVHTMRVIIKSVEQYTPQLQAIVMGELTAQEFIEQDLEGKIRQNREGFIGFLRELIEALERAVSGSSRPRDNDYLR